MFNVVSLRRTLRCSYFEYYHKSRTHLALAKIRTPLTLLQTIEFLMGTTY